MQKFKKELSFILIFGLVVALFGACSDEEYFKADPIANSKTIDIDTYTYLSSKPDQFSAFVEVIDLSNSKELINNANSTVIAPQNYSIKRFVFEQGKETLSDFQAEELQNLLKQYIVNARIVSEDLTQPVSTTNIFGGELVFEIKREKWKGVDNIGPQYISLNNLKNINDDKDDIQVKVVTPDLQTTTGVVHVLTNDHLFGF
jgi:hypothetical protein